MNDPRQMLTEETPESPKDFASRRLTEIDGAIQHSPQTRVLTEDLPEDEEDAPRTLMG